MKKHLAALVCGFGAGVLQVVPITKSLTCCVIIPAAVFIAIVLDRKANRVPEHEKTETKKAIIIGAFTGIFAALFGSFFEILITLITKTNDIILAFPEIQNILDNFPLSEEVRTDVVDLFQLIIDDIQQTGFSLFYSLSVVINNFIVNTIFGILGGLIGVQLINSRITNANKQ